MRIEILVFVVTPTGFKFLFKMWNDSFRVGPLDLKIVADPKVFTALASRADDKIDSRTAPRTTLSRQTTRRNRSCGLD